MSALPSMGNSGLLAPGEDLSPFFAPSGTAALFSALVRTSRPVPGLRARDRPTGAEEDRRAPGSRRARGPRAVRAGRGARRTPMIVHQAYRFALDPTAAQQRALASHVGAARFASNWGLEPVGVPATALARCSGCSS